jgi:hypothetical protein
VARTQPLRDLGPVLDTTALIPARELSKLHMDPPAPAPGIGDGFMLSELDGAAVDAIVASAGAESGSTLLSVEFRHLGGALSRSKKGDGVALLDAAFAMFAVGIGATAELAEQTHRDVAKVLTALEPWDSGRDYLNWRETRQPGERLFSAERYERLLEIKSKVDPDDVFRSHHPV